MENWVTANAIAYADAGKVTNRKQAIIAGTFLIFIVYMAAVVVSYIKKESQVKTHVINHRIMRILNQYNVANWDIFVLPLLIF